MNLEENQEIFESLFKLIRVLRTKNLHEMGNSDLSILQTHTLIFIKKNQPIPMHEIAESFRITKPTVTSLIDVLMKSGYVGRVDDKKDRRITRIKLTEKGENFLAKNMKKAGSKINKILNYLSAKDRKDLLRIFGTINQKIEEDYEKELK